jgi:hypothetical protein
MSAAKAAKSFDSCEAGLKLITVLEVAVNTGQLRYSSQSTRTSEKKRI